MQTPRSAMSRRGVLKGLLAAPVVVWARSASANAAQPTAALKSSARTTARTHHHLIGVL